eukprot:364369-Chlamydomonas_euryale.AAC.7
MYGPSTPARTCPFFTYSLEPVAAYQLHADSAVETASRSFTAYQLHADSAVETASRSFTAYQLHADSAVETARMSDL